MPHETTLIMAVKKSTTKPAGSSSRKTTTKRPSSKTAGKTTGTSSTKKVSSRPRRATSKKRGQNTPLKALFARPATFFAGLWPTTKKRTRKRKSPSRLPLVFAFAAGLLMAGICFVGIQSLKSPAPSPLPNNVSVQANQTGQQQGTVQQRPRPSPKHVQQPPTSLKKEEAETTLAVQQALNDLQVTASTDSITPFSELSRQANFALLQAALNAAIPLEHIRVLKQEERDHTLGQYTFQRIAILGEKGFPQLIANTLESWGTQAQLRRIRPNTFAITVKGVTTHEIQLFTKAAEFTKTFRATPPPVYPPKRPAHSQPRITIVIDDLGASPKALQRLMRLNYPVTCAFWPDAAHTQKGARLAHRAGLEILVHMPMEPMGYPRVKPGTNALLETMSSQKIITLTQNAIHKVPYAVGLNNHMGSKLTQNRKKTQLVLSILAQNKLFMLDSVTHGKTVFYDMAGAFGMPRYKRSVFLDADDSPAAIMASLAKTERIAQLTGQAIAIGHPLPNTLNALEKWQHTRNKAIQVVRLHDLPNQGR